MHSRMLRGGLSCASPAPTRNPHPTCLFRKTHAELQEQRVLQARVAEERIPLMRKVCATRRGGRRGRRRAYNRRARLVSLLLGGSDLPERLQGPDALVVLLRRHLHLGVELDQIHRAHIALLLKQHTGCRITDEHLTRARFSSRCLTARRASCRGSRRGKRREGGAKESA